MVDVSKSLTGIIKGSCCFILLFIAADQCTHYNRNKKPKQELFMLFLITLGLFWCSVVTSVTFSSNLSNFKKLQKIQKNAQKNPKKSKISNIPKIQQQKNYYKNPRKIQKKSPKTKKIEICIISLQTLWRSNIIVSLQIFR